MEVSEPQRPAEDGPRKAMGSRLTAAQVEYLVSQRDEHGITYRAEHKEAREAIAKHLNLEVAQMHVWFKNHRLRDPTLKVEAQPASAKIKKRRRSTADPAAEHSAEPKRSTADRPPLRLSEPTLRPPSSFLEPSTESSRSILHDDTAAFDEDEKDALALAAHKRILTDLDTLNALGFSSMLALHNEATDVGSYDVRGPLAVQATEYLLQQKKIDMQNFLKDLTAANKLYPELRETTNTHPTSSASSPQ
ncbi:hypothetical protein SDRG_14759 [Saprolegnia diclina VS20]|uniref:Homeobox domain-containing protein n=1 Tax=Saprolegnia diclina (strain VS20) TaxID=1156394 RepID=T0Q243_SAPDV|nr:hypothetical protein SDRG_14759 [Saprolegnia diclina VS20]EQC27435.1 hypothetical protein SDRG_14759 [Saprolegnia diclina VS20]|eukprot:XP_008619135.1 hypothetical protein SDRG_14759 [Saprolegnia diclina VS20]